MAVSEETTATGFRAVHRFARIPARKARTVVDLVRGRPVNEALERLQYCPKRAAPMVRKVLQSAIANAGQDLDVDANRLYVHDVRADDGPTVKRGRARSRGQFFGILVRSCHISIELREAPEGGLPRKDGKPRRVRGAGKKTRAPDPAAKGAGAAGTEA